MAQTKITEVMMDDKSVDASKEIAMVFSIANTLRGPYKPDKYKEVIIPMIILRRLECALAPTKKAVVDAFKKNPATLILIQFLGAKQLSKSHETALFRGFYRFTVPFLSQICTAIMPNSFYSSKKQGSLNAVLFLLYQFPCSVLFAFLFVIFLFGVYIPHVGLVGYARFDILYSFK